ncbi:RHS repeat-associated core domain-containing protein [Caballeronia sp.]|uniref:RHS repeat-associated core domain-containing protein n=1 Tax=Caballeronia sp. TaxID=1931223 RepID=UPI003C40D59F
MTNVNGPGSDRGDPIDMVHGNFLYEHQDIKTGYGDWPDSLNFQRLYSSGMKNQSGVLGKGWTHNFDIRLRTSSDGFIGMGDRLALDAVGTIVEHKASLDLLNDRTEPAEKFLSAVVAQRWFGDQLVDNTRIVTFGLNSEVFARLPDGSFSAPPGNGSFLNAQFGANRMMYQAVNGAYYSFNVDKVSFYSQKDGKKTTFVWSGNQLTSVNNHAGRTLTLTYANNRLQSVSSPQQTVRYTYDGNDNLVSETDPEGFATRFEYDQPGRMTKFYQPSFPNTPVVSNTYDTLGRVKTQTSAAGHLFNYYFAGSRSEEVGPGGSSRTDYIDAEGNLLQMADPMGNWTLKEYDGQNRLVRETRPEGNRTEYTYDDASCLRATNPARLCTHQIAAVSRFPRAGTGDAVLTQRFTYDPSWDTLSTATDARGLVTTSVYSAYSLQKVIRPMVGGVAPTTSITYESVTLPGTLPTYLYRPVRVTETIDATRSTATAISYGADFTPAITTQDADGLAVKTVTTFDNEGRLITNERDGFETVTNTYDKRGNVTRTNAKLLGVDEVIGYDADSREISRGVAVVGGAMVTCKRYNAMGDVVREWGPAKTTGVSTCPVEVAPTQITDTAYDDHHRPFRVTRFMSAADGGNRIAETTYNADDSVKSIRKAVNLGLEQSYASYVYNGNGTVASTTDAKGNTTVNLYDGHDRLYRTHYPLDGQPGKGDVGNYEQYTWDSNNNLIAMRKRDGQTIGQSFDALDRLATRTFPSGVSNVQYSYDLRGLKTASQYSNGSHTVTNTYDGMGQLTQTSAGGRTLRYEYDEAGNISAMTWPEGFRVMAAYDSYRRPRYVSSSSSAHLVRYTYDTLNRATLLELDNGTRTELSYDAQGWLSNKNHRFTGSTEDWVGSFTRNQLGEIKQTSVTNNQYGWTSSAVSVAYKANALNQYTVAGGKDLRYDGNGNLTGDGAWTYGYDLDNRMTTASRTGTNATLGYDPEGRLIRTTVNGTETNLLYDGQHLVAEYDSTGKLTRRYIFVPGLEAPLAQYEGISWASGAASYLYADQQGSIVALANSTGATTSSQAYGPFGETEGAPASRFAYTGQQYLAPLGLYYYKARMYSPTLGRFLQTDPIGTKDDLNLYAYVKNNPVNFTDPTGLLAKTQTGSNFNTNIAAAPATAPKLDAPTFTMPATAAANQAAVQVAGMPFEGAAGSWASAMPGKMPQLRMYGPNGTASVDIDMEAHHGNLDPHAHNWEGTVRDHGWPVSILP